MRELTNDGWGVESNCFVCEPTNDAGLRIRFFHDESAEVVTATFELDDRFSGAPTYLHGGVVLAVLDEAMAWATIAIGRRWAVTGELTTRFEEPVRVGGRYRVVSSLVGSEPSASTLAAEAVISDSSGRLCARAEATFVVLGEAQAAQAVGVGAGDLVDPFSVGPT